jgi:hypothetical protein
MPDCLNPIRQILAAERHAAHRRKGPTAEPYIAQGANIVRRELGLPATYVPAADPMLQIDVVPGR